MGRKRMREPSCEDKLRMAAKALFDHGCTRREVEAMMFASAGAFRGGVGLGGMEIMRALRSAQFQEFPEGYGVFE